MVHDILWNLGLTLLTLSFETFYDTNDAFAKTSFCEIIDSHLTIMKLFCFSYTIIFVNFSVITLNLQ